MDASGRQQRLAIYLLRPASLSMRRTVKLPRSREGSSALCDCRWRKLATMVGLVWECSPNSRIDDTTVAPSA
jgi:hypothetical protein